MNTKATRRKDTLTRIKTSRMILIKFLILSNKDMRSIDLASRKMSGYTRILQENKMNSPHELYRVLAITVLHCCNNCS